VAVSVHCLAFDFVIEEVDSTAHEQTVLLQGISSPPPLQGFFAN